MIRDSGLEGESPGYDRPQIFDFECEYADEDDDEDDPKEWH